LPWPARAGERSRYSKQESKSRSQSLNASEVGHQARVCEHGREGTAGRRWRRRSCGETTEGLPHEIGIQAADRPYDQGFDLIVDNGASRLPEAAEDAFDDDLVALPHFGLAEADDF
jgi:hypothetical protein